VGQLLDWETGGPIEGVAIRIVDVARARQFTNIAGRFVFDSVPRGVQGWRSSTSPMVR
jgi:hypothetical protein